MAKYLAELPERYDQGEAYEHYTRARKATIDLLIAAAPTINRLLNADQRRKLPALVASYLDTRYLAGIRSGTVGGGGGGAFGGFGGGGWRRWWWRRWRLRSRTGRLTDAQRYRDSHRHINAQIDLRAARGRAARLRVARVVRVGPTAVGRTAFAQQPSAQQPSERPPARPLGQAIATSDPMGAISAVRQLPGGRVLVNDPARRRVVMLDSNMKLIKVVADTTPMTQNAYGARGGGLLPWHGDSTLFLDPASLSMLVLDQDGEIRRVMAAPRPDDVFSLVGGALGFPGFDAKGRLVYRATGLNFNRRGPGGGGAARGGFQPPTFPDSTPLVRFDLATRKLDTVAKIKVAAPRINFTENRRTPADLAHRQSDARGGRLGGAPRRDDRHRAQGLPHRLHRRRREEDRLVAHSL